MLGQPLHLAMQRAADSPEPLFPPVHSWANPVKANPASCPRKYCCLAGWHRRTGRTPKAVIAMKAIISRWLFWTEQKQKSWNSCCLVCLWTQIVGFGHSWPVLWIHQMQWFGLSFPITSPVARGKLAQNRPFCFFMQNHFPSVWLRLIQPVRFLLIYVGYHQFKYSTHGHW